MVIRWEVCGALAEVCGKRIGKQRTAVMSLLDGEHGGRVEVNTGLSPLGQCL